jgi:hypothetical protein
MALLIKADGTEFTMTPAGRDKKHHFALRLGRRRANPLSTHLRPEEVLLLIKGGLPDDVIRGLLSRLGGRRK